MGNSFKHRLVVGMHFVHLVAKEFRGCFKGKFWCSVLPLFYVEAIYLITSIEKFGSHFSLRSCDHFRLFDSQNSGQIGDHRKLILEETKIIINCLG